MMLTYLESLAPNQGNILVCIKKLEDLELGLSEHIREMNRDSVWYPEYGCAVLIQSIPYVGKIRLKCVALDGWEIARTCSTIELKHYAISKSSKVIEIGMICQDLLDVLKENIKNRLNKAQGLGAEERSERGKRGHQKTPAFIEALYRQAIRQGKSTSEIMVLPYGGTTDCGLHTGGVERSTPWPLVWAVLEEIIQDDERMRKANIEFYISCMKSSLKDGDVPDGVMTAMKRAVPIINQLNTEGLDVVAYVNAVCDMRKTLERDLSKENLAFAERHTLRPSPWNTNTAPALALPALRLTSTVGHSSEVSYRDKALRAIGQVEARVEVQVDCFEVTLTWAKGHEDKQLVVALIEDVFLAAAQHLSICPSRPTRLSAASLEALVQLKDYYKSQVMARGLDLKTEAKSRRLLAEWICCCLVHQHCISVFPNVEQWRLPLKYDTLCVAVVKNKNQEDALLAVAR